MSSGSKPQPPHRHRTGCAPSLDLPNPLTGNASVALDPLVRAAQTGDATAFATLYDAHAPRLFAVCVGLAGNRVDAAELLQDTFVRAWERLGTFRGESAFPTWLHRVAVNVFLLQERTRRRRVQRVAVESELISNAGVGEALATAVPDAITPALDIGLRVDLETAIARLPDGARRVFVLYDIAGYEHAEIAQQLGIAEGTSKSHLFRARRLLRGMLDR
ncbi:RNA polymerase sigma factor [Gemmatimonas sp.]|uniref:RNA polymerase sigma factor n=1 Tax=Gemmatimonas sp. TaxID=1962908 RepID=UPI00356AB441